MVTMATVHVVPLIVDTIIQLIMNNTLMENEQSLLLSTMLYSAYRGLVALVRELFTVAYKM